jgi:hypothetical protein
MAANQEFVRKGGVFASIFPNSQVALGLLKPNEEKLTYAR